MKIAIGNEDETFTKKRLDRSVANLKWLELFGNGEIEVLISRCADHNQLLLTMTKESVAKRKKKSTFKY